MIELYSVKDVAKLFNQTESRLRYWISSGFLWPSVRRQGKYFYTFDDLIAIRTAVELLESGISVQKVRKALTDLRKELPDGIQPTSKLRICSDGQTIVVLGDGVVYEAHSKQLVMAFSVSSIQHQIAEILPISGKAPREQLLRPPTLVVNSSPESPDYTAYQLFLHACSAEEEGAFDVAERFLRQCLAQEDSMAAAHTNLGNLLHKKGSLSDAQACYESALLYEPGQPEARYNLANLLEELGDRDLAISELRQVCSRSPQFADAHYNLGLLLTEVGGRAQARVHLEHYLQLDPDSQWSTCARQQLEACAD